MRSNCLLTSLLLFSFIINEAQGIRLRKGTISLPADHREHNIHEIVPLKRNNDGIIDEEDKAVVICAGKKCSGRTNRKLIVTTPSTIKTAKSQNNKNKANNDHDHPKSEDNSTNKSIQRKEENLSVNSSSAITEEHRPTTEPYPDVIDIAGMDYSQARRRPPIHN